MMSWVAPRSSSTSAEKAGRIWVCALVMGELPSDLLRTGAEEQRLLRDLPRGLLVLQPRRLPLQCPLLLRSQLRGTTLLSGFSFTMRQLCLCVTCAAFAACCSHGAELYTRSHIAQVEYQTILFSIGCCMYITMSDRQRKQVIEEYH